jgi:hypothetical protein
MTKQQSDVVLQLEAKIEHLLELLKEARQYVSDAGNDEDPETQQLSASLLIEIDSVVLRRNNERAFK